jgi:hypothetical protein
MNQKQSAKRVLIQIPDLLFSEWMQLQRQSKELEAS